MFSCEFCEIFKNNFFYRTPLVAASETINLVSFPATENFLKSAYYPY